MGAASLAFCPFGSISGRPAEIESKAPVSSATPGLKEQYEQQTTALRQGAANVEFLTIPGFYSFPRTSFLIYLIESP